MNELAGEAAGAPAESGLPESVREVPVPPEPRILVVSSDTAEARAVARGLARAGTRAAAVSPGEVAAWDEAIVQAVDVFVVVAAVLDDPQMALLERIRERSPTAEIVVVSPDPAVEDTVQAVRAGVHSVLRAPALPDELALEVTKALARRRWAKQRLRVLARVQGSGR
ncbi:MAG: hypothetical protein HY905_27625 [Deltaproteobacteria bacterium]|nr:hypothetical protein [Deltaproteobacteria bacterium]